MSKYDTPEGCAMTALAIFVLLPLLPYDDGEHQRNIKVYKAGEVTDEFDTKTEFDDEKD